MMRVAVQLTIEETNVTGTASNQSNKKDLRSHVPSFDKLYRRLHCHRQGAREICAVDLLYSRSTIILAALQHTSSGLCCAALCMWP